MTNSTWGGDITCDSPRGRKRYQRHNSFQVRRLEEFFKECHHPNDKQRRQLSKELGLEPIKIKFWFQNKRTQLKAQNERAGTNALRAENERIKFENFTMSKTAKNAICMACRPSPDREDRQPVLQQLQIENAQLHEEFHEICTLLSNYTGIPISEIVSLQPTSGSSLDLSLETFLGQIMEGLSPDVEPFSRNSSRPTSPYKLKGLEKSLAIQTAVNAFDEVIRLLQFNERLWIKDPTEGSLVLHHDSYKQIFPKTSHLKSLRARFESSKVEGLVRMHGTQLVDIFLDSDNWVDFFPTIVKKATTIQELESGMSESRHGCLKLMYEKMHILLPLVAPREFHFLRYCQQINPGLWVVTDVSYDCLEENQNPSICASWRLPSGCMIQDMSNGWSKVTWMEHVEVDDKTLSHRLYRDFTYNSSAYGAQRWLITLQRTGERFAYSMMECSPSLELGVLMPEGRRSIMNLSHRMVKNFCACLAMRGKMDIPYLSEMKNSGVQISVRKSIPGQPNGIIVTTATSLWLPLPFQIVFNFFKDHKTRAQWDVLSGGRAVQEIANISYGSHPDNCISVIQPFMPRENNLVMLQESCIDPLGSLVVYCPIDTQTLDQAISTEDSSNIPILPSGFIICSDGSGGSLLTVALQVLICNPSSLKQLDEQSVANVNALISSMVHKIKAALNCTGLD